MSDTWFTDRTAPESDKDDGCHPQEAEVLKKYLRGNIATASEAARAITLPIENESDPIVDVPRLWGLLIDALTDLPASRQKVIQLLEAITELPPPSQAGEKGPKQLQFQALWRELLGFGHLWADLYHTDRWRRLVKTCSPAERVGFRREIQTTAAVEAQLVLAHLGDIPLAWGHDCICDALEKSDAVVDVEVPAAAEWLKVVGKRIYGEIPEAETNYALASWRDLWKAGEKMSEERWKFWKERLRVIAQTEGLGQGTRDAANVATEAMEAAEE